MANITATRPRRVNPDQLLDGRTIAEALAAIALGGGPPAALRTDEFAPAPAGGPLGTFAGDAPLPSSIAGPPLPVLPPVALGAIPEAATDPPGGPPLRPPIYSGERTEGLSPLGKLLVKRRLLADPRNLNRQVRETGEGMELTREGGPPSRKLNAVLGALQGLRIAGEGGNPWAALGGVATGAITGAVNPRMIKAFNRQGEIDLVDRDIDRQSTMDLAQARIGGVEAQAEADRARPLIDALRIQTQDAQAAERIAAQREATAQRGESAREATNQRSKAAEAVRAARAAERAERERHNRAVEQKSSSQYRVDSDTGDIIAIDPGTNTTSVIRKGSKQHGAVAKAQALWAAAGKQYDNDAKPKFAEADAKRAEAAELSASPTLAVRNAERIKQLNRQADRLDREAEGIATKVRAMQVEGDKLAAEAEGAGGGIGNQPGTFDLAKWKADHPGADDTAVRAKARKRGLRIIE